MAVATPTSTPKPIITKLSSAIAKGFAKPEPKVCVGQFQFDLLDSTPERMAAIVKETRERWQPVITKAKIIIE